jgi:ACS family hexuronate transporter-like MFS transporter
LFFAITINYIDRAVLGVLKPLLGEKLGWDQKDYGWMVTAFQATYAAGYLLAGRLVDRLGVRVGLWLAVSAWSVAAMAHALATGIFNAGSPVGAMSWRWNMASPACPSCRCACGWCGNSTRS